jgi:hypothetical protein
MAERRKMELCNNCDEPYVRGHKCARLLYLEAQDYIVEVPADDDDAPVAARPPTLFDLDMPMISLSAITGIRREETMQLRVRCGGQDFVALLDSGSTHDVRRQQGHPCCGWQWRSGACRGLAQQVPIQIREDVFNIDRYSIALDALTWCSKISGLIRCGPRCH